jgi:hypothetical protein
VTDLAAHPLQLNERFRVTADELQWIVQKRRNRGTWEGVIFCRTRDGLIANIGYEVFGVGEVNPDALTRLKSLPAHLRDVVREAVAA